MDINEQQARIILDAFQMVSYEWSGVGQEKWEVVNYIYRCFPSLAESSEIELGE